MNDFEYEFATNIVEAEFLKSTLDWHATMTTFTTIVAAFMFLAIAVWKIT